MSNIIEWKGGECPVPALTAVTVTCRDGTKETGLAQEFDWVHLFPRAEDDIVAYEVDEEQPNFIEWTGGVNPAPGKLVEAAYRYNAPLLYVAASESFDWEHVENDSDADIVFYRVIN